MTRAWTADRGGVGIDRDATVRGDAGGGEAGRSTGGGGVGDALSTGV
jgi:hypothetical protein